MYISLDYTVYILLLFLGVRVYLVKKSQYRLIPVLTFLKYRYYTELETLEPRCAGQIWRSSTK
jgi:hypothetical protein